MIEMELPEVLNPAECAAAFGVDTKTVAAFGVDTKTVARWAKDGKLSCFRTPGGHRRFFASDVRALQEASDRQVRPAPRF